MYAEPKNKADALKGLILLAEGAADQDKVKKYSERARSRSRTVSSTAWPRSGRIWTLDWFRKRSSSYRISSRNIPMMRGPA